MNEIQHIQNQIDKTMLENDEFYTSVVTYFKGRKDLHSAQTVLWEFSHSPTNGSFFTSLDLHIFKSALDTFPLRGGGHEK